MGAPRVSIGGSGGCLRMGGRRPLLCLARHASCHRAPRVALLQTRTRTVTLSVSFFFLVREPLLQKNGQWHLLFRFGVLDSCSTGARMPIALVWDPWHGRHTVRNLPNLRLYRCMQATP